MDARTLLAASAVGLIVSLLAEQATGAEGPVLRKAPSVPAVAIDPQLFRREVDSYVRELNEQIRANIEEQIRRELAPKIVLASDELRARG